MFGHESLPSKIASFKALRPTVGEQEITEQISLSHKYRNKLVEIERRRRDLVNQYLVANCRWVPIWTNIVQAFVDDMKGHEEEVNRQSSKDRKRKQSPALSAARQSLRRARACLRKARKRAFAKDHIKSGLAAIDGNSREEQKSARGDASVDGLYWGNYLAIEQAAQSYRKGAPPRFQRWTGSGRIVTQIQKGITLADAKSGSDRRLIIERNGKRAKAWVRIGSDGRDPVWAIVPFHWDQSRDVFPDEAIIKWVYVVRETECDGRHVRPDKYRWAIQFVISRAGGFNRGSGSDGVVAIDLGYRMLPDGNLRVAYWYDGKTCGEVLIPCERLSLHQTSRNLQEIRDRNFNEVVAEFAGWLDSREVPGWLTDRTQYLTKWRDKSRLAKIVWDWKDQRFDGDAAMFDVLWHWRKREMHLCRYGDGRRRRFLAWRTDFYRQFAAELRRQYHTVVFENIDWRHLAKRADVGEEDNRRGQHNRMLAAPSELKRIVSESLNVVEVPAKNTTRRCHVCGHTEAFDAATELLHQCSGCGSNWDQDRNAAINLWRLGCERLEECKVAGVSRDNCDD